MTLPHRPFRVRKILVVGRVNSKPHEKSLGSLELNTTLLYSKSLETRTSVCTHTHT